MSKRFTLKSIALCALLAGAAGLVGTAQAQTKLKWAHVYETSEAYHTSSVWAADEIKKRTNGKFEIQVFPASTLGKESDINQGLQLGTVDIIISGASFAARSFPRIGVAYYPYTFRDADHLLKYAQSDVFKELAEGYKQKTGIQTTAVTYYGARHSTSNKLFTKCEEMKGLKMRVPDVPAYMALPRACGANPTPIAFAEVYLALQNGTVDAQENPLPTIEAKKFYEVQKKHHPDRPHPGFAGHASRPPRLEQAQRRREEDLHRCDAGSRHPRHRRDHQARERSGGRVQEEGHQHGRSQQERLPRPDREGGGHDDDGLRQEGLGPHPGYSLNCVQPIALRSIRLPPSKPSPRGEGLFLVR